MKHVLMGTLFFLGFLVTCETGIAQKHKKSKIAVDTVSLNTKETKKDSAGLKKMDEILKGENSPSVGLFTVHQVKDKYYFEIPTKLFSREFLVVNRVAKAPVNMNIQGRKFTGFTGDIVGENIIKFDQGPKNKLFIRRVFYIDVSTDSTKPMYKSIQRNSLQPILAALSIVAYSKDSSSVLVDMTDFLQSDNDLFYFSSNFSKMLYSIGGQQNDKSYVESVKSYPSNVELKAVKTFSLTGNNNGGDITFELNSSTVMLPDTLMRPRMFDERVGYFTENYFDYDANPDGVKPVMMVARWRLEPKAEDQDKYLHGILVEPKKPIVFYIDRTTPSQWVPYLIEGVNDWNKAFEMAGFKNAIVAKLAPTTQEDSTFSLEDARHNAIVYKPSLIANANGPHISDPRTGEILESHVNWYHNVMELIHNWYMIQCGPLDSSARHMVFSDSLMGQLIRFVSSHEIGHTLGLRHNFGASSTIPVDSLRSITWLKKYGFCPSIMDYARFNYVAQPEDHIPAAYLWPRIGEYDKWAIAWGYRWFPDSVSDQTATNILSKWTTNNLRANKRLWFGSEMLPTDPRCQNEDLGDDNMKANAYGIKNLKRVVAQLSEWTKTPNENYDNLSDLYKALNIQYDRYLIHVIKYIGGTYVTPNLNESGLPVYEPVSSKKQQEALSFLLDQLYTAPTWLVNAKLIGKIKMNPVYDIGQRQDVVLDMIMNNYKLNTLITDRNVYGSKCFSVEKLFSMMDDFIWKDLHKAKENIYTRNLQKMYLDKLLKLAYPAMPYGVNTQGMLIRPVQADPSMPELYGDIASICKLEVKKLLVLLEHKRLGISDPLTASHIQDMIERIHYMLKQYHY